MSVKKLLFALLLCLAPHVAHATTFYTSTTGSNDNSCSQAQSTGTPKLTIGEGMACLSPR